MKKPRTQIKGNVLFPVEPGGRAILATERGLMLTTCVVKIRKNTKRKLVIETEHSIYDVMIEKQKTA